MIKYASLLLLLFTPALFHAQSISQFGMSEGDDIPKGLPVGAKAPVIEVTNQDGSSVSLFDGQSNDPVVLIFYRGAWCPYCTRYLSAINDSVKLIEDAGARVIAISPEPPALLKKVENAGNIERYSDHDDSAMKAFDLDFLVTEDYQQKIEAAKGFRLDENNEQEEASLPVPATYVIDGDGNILFRHFDYNYKNRSSVQAILHALNPE